MALNFPNSPSLNATHTHNGLTWVWNGSVWEMQGSGGASVTVSDNAPSSPTHGDMWWESDTGDLKIYYDESCLLYTSPSPRDLSTSRMPSSA